MIDRRIGKIKIRRGTDTQRKSILFPEGELLYTTDYKRVYVGDGNTNGGVVISNRNHIVIDIDTANPPSNVLYGDIIHNKTDSTTYIVGSADNGSLSALLIADPLCCIRLKAQIDDLKIRVNEISACVTRLRPVIPKPPTGSLVFVIQPSNVSINVGETATFTASAVAPGVITYQWYRADTNSPVAGAIYNTFIINSVQISDIANYYCKATSSTLGSLNSNQVSLTVGGNSILSDPDGVYILSDTDGGYIDWDFSTNLVPNIILQPKSIVTTSLVPATFSIDATGSEPLLYQWRINGVDQIGETNKTFTVTNPTIDILNITCKVSNLIGEVISNSVNLTVGIKPTIKTQPLTQNVGVGYKAILSVVANGSSPLNYQWYKDSSTIIGATSNVYQLNSAAYTDSGIYKCVVSNQFGQVESNEAILNVEKVYQDVVMSINIDGGDYFDWSDNIQTTRHSSWKYAGTPTIDYKIYTNSLIIEQGTLKGKNSGSTTLPFNILKTKFVTLTKNLGRSNNVTITQMPSFANNYKTTVYIYDQYDASANYKYTLTFTSE